MCLRELPLSVWTTTTTTPTALSRSTVIVNVNANRLGPPLKVRRHRSQRSHALHRQRGNTCSGRMLCLFICLLVCIYLYPYLQQTVLFFIAIETPTVNGCNLYLSLSLSPSLNNNTRSEGWTLPSPPATSSSPTSVPPLLLACGASSSSP